MRRFLRILYFIPAVAILTLWIATHFTYFHMVKSHSKGMAAVKVNHGSIKLDVSWLEGIVGAIPITTMPKGLKNYFLPYLNQDMIGMVEEELKAKDAPPEAIEYISDMIRPTLLRTLTANIQWVFSGSIFKSWTLQSSVPLILLFAITAIPPSLFLVLTSKKA